MLENITLKPLLDSVERIQMEDPEYFALDAISDAQEAVIEAVKARAEANSY